ncbi:YbjN domain-containing protein [Pseudomonas tremae]|uniref:YbjN domain-containing protein n=1 Tax=Pseudomonas tremae TaxID=200454 RepID=UPI001F1701BD|nr:YbjN domain-containing protein [Pseudomonas tremae]MCF5715461.1 hypothetical protein [Pseudomonas tremae]UQB33692.1 YbjN domain-containing protein [Pseudomonas tremae]
MAVEINALKKKNSLSKVYIKALDSLGVKSVVDADGDVVFKSLGSNDSTLIAIIEADHKEFLRIAHPRVYKVDSPEVEIKALRACNWANRETKVAKLYVSEGGTSVWAAYEVHMPEFDLARVKEQLRIAMVVIEAIVEQFAEAIQGSLK